MRYLTFTDLHLREDNWQICRAIFVEIVEVCKKEKIDTVAFLGDFVDSRKALSFDVFQTMQYFERLMSQNNIKVYCLVGNHDKQDYLSESSWLDMFDSSDTIEVVKGRMFIEELQAVGVPYFDEKSKVCSEHLEGAIKIALGRKEKTGQDIDLLTHLAISGVKNNDGSEQENNITPASLKVFRNVKVGHYHNRSKLGDNIEYIGSTRQNNFGEDSDKGYTITESDTGESTRHRFTCVPSYETVTIDLTEHKTSESVMKALNKAKKGFSEDARVRLVAEGPEELTSLIPSKDCKSLGIRIKHKKSDVEVDTSYINIEEYEPLTDESIVVEWKSFKDNIKGVSKSVINNVELKITEANGKS